MFCANAETTVKLGSIAGTPGSSATLELQLVNDDANFVPCAYQCDITLPEGVTISKVATSALSSHTVASNTLSDGKYRILCYSMTNEAIPAGTVASFVVDLASTVSTSAQFTVSNIEIADKNSLAVNPDSNNAGFGTASSEDISGDGIVDAEDVSIIIKHILADDNSVGDVNGDNIVDAEDISIVIQYILNH